MSHTTDNRSEPLPLLKQEGAVMTDSMHEPGVRPAGRTGAAVNATPVLPRLPRDAVGSDWVSTWMFDLPFPPPPPAEDHPFYRKLSTETEDFQRACGILRTHDDIARFRRHDLAMWTVFCYPRYPFDSLRIICDFISLAAEWDHLLSGPAGRGAGRELLTPLKSIVEGRDIAADGAFTIAWRDIWRRWLHGMAGPWRARTAAHWSAIFAALIDEDLGETAGTCATIEDKGRLRDQTGLQSVLFDLIERAGSFHIPADLLDTPEMREMLFHANRQIWMTNEIQSLPKELADGESNLILVMETEHEMSRTEALFEVHRRLRCHTDTFLAYEARIPHALDRLQVPVEHRVEVYRFITGMRDVMAGAAAWGANSGRYQNYRLDREPHPGNTT